MDNYTRQNICLFWQRAATCSLLLCLAFLTMGCQTTDSLNVRVVDQNQRPLPAISVHYITPQDSLATDVAFLQAAKGRLLGKTDSEGFATIQMPKEPGYLYVRWPAGGNRQWPIDQDKAQVTAGGELRFTLYNPEVLDQAETVAEPEAIRFEAGEESLSSESWQLKAKEITPDFSQIGTIVIPQDSPDDE